MYDHRRNGKRSAGPELAADKRHRQAVRVYLDDPSIPPAVLRRPAAPDPARARRVFQADLDEADVDWERDGEVLLQRFKPEAVGRPPLPSVTPLPDHLARAQLEATQEPPAALARTGPSRNAPCPCGSGLKYKRCCGR